MTDEVARALHEATLALLENTGVAVESEKARDLLAAEGVPIDTAHRAHPCEEHVARALELAPPTFDVYGRRNHHPLTLGGDHHWVLSGGGSVRVLTLDGRYEPSTWEHLHQFNVLLDALPHIHMRINQVDPQGDDAPGFYRRLAAEMLVDSPKPCCMQASSPADVAAMVEMGAALRGSGAALAARPVFMVGVNAEPPLRIPASVADTFIAACRAGVPVSLGDYGMMGITAPMTVAGAAVQLNAVQLVALILSQAARPGAAVCYTAFSGAGNMRTLDPIIASPATVQLLRLTAGLGRHYGLPVYGEAVTDARAPDPQAACERAVQLMDAILAGVNLIQGPTSHMDQMMLSSYVQAIIDDDIVGYVLEALRPPDLSPEALALEAMHDVAHDSALAHLRYAAHDHTVRHLRDGAFQPRAFSYDSFSTWERDGGRSVVERAAEAAREILATHRPEPLAPALAEELRRIARADWP